LTAMLVAIRTAAAPSQFAVTLNKTGSGDGTVTGAGTYDSGTLVRIEAIPDGTSIFTSWSNTVGDSCVGAGETDPVQFIPLTQATTCLATFTLDTPPPPVNFNLTITIAGGVGGTTTPAAGVSSHLQGTVVNMTATPASSAQRFVAWSGDADCTDGQVTMSAARACTATFENVPTFLLTLTTTGTGSGSVTGGGTFAENVLAPITATPAVGSTFGGWAGSAGCVSATANFSILMDAAKTCTATFTSSSQGPPTGVLIVAPIRRCAISLLASPTLGAGLTVDTVTWYIDGVSVVGQNRLRLYKSLQLEGAIVTADVRDSSGTTGTLGPVTWVCP